MTEKNIPVEVCPTSNLACYKKAFGAVKHLHHLKILQELNHNFVICTDDTSKYSLIAEHQTKSVYPFVCFVVLFSTNISTELFEYAHGFDVSTQDLKDRLVRNVDAIFDDSYKEELRQQIESYRI